MEITTIYIEDDDVYIEVDNTETFRVSQEELIRILIEAECFSTITGGPR